MARVTVIAKRGGTASMQDVNLSENAVVSIHAIGRDSVATMSSNDDRGERAADVRRRAAGDERRRALRNKKDAARRAAEDASRQAKRDYDRLCRSRLDEARRTKEDELREHEARLQSQRRRIWEQIDASVRNRNDAFRKIDSDFRVGVSPPISLETRNILLQKALDEANFRCSELCKTLHRVAETCRLDHNLSNAKEEKLGSDIASERLASENAYHRRLSVCNADFDMVCSEVIEELAALRGPVQPQPPSTLSHRTQPQTETVAELTSAFSAGSQLQNPFQDAPPPPYESGEDDEDDAQTVIAQVRKTNSVDDAPDALSEDARDDEQKQEFVEQSLSLASSSRPEEACAELIAIGQKQQPTVFFHVGVYWFFFQEEEFPATINQDGISVVNLHGTYFQDYMRHDTPFVLVGLNSQKVIDLSVTLLSDSIEYRGLGNFPEAVFGKLGSKAWFEKGLPVHVYDTRGLASYVREGLSFASVLQVIVTYSSQSYVLLQKVHPASTEWSLLGHRAYGADASPINGSVDHLALAKKAAQEVGIVIGDGDRITPGLEERVKMTRLFVPAVSVTKSFVLRCTADSSNRSLLFSSLFRDENFDEAKKCYVLRLEKNVRFMAWPVQDAAEGRGPVTFFEGEGWTSGMGSDVPDCYAPAQLHMRFAMNKIGDPHITLDAQILTNEFGFADNLGYLSVEWRDYTLAYFSSKLKELFSSTAKTDERLAVPDVAPLPDGGRDDDVANGKPVPTPSIMKQQPTPHDPILSALSFDVARKLSTQALFNLRDAEGNNILHYAAYYLCDDFVKHFAVKFDRRLFEERNSLGMCPIHVALMSNSTNVHRAFRDQHRLHLPLPTKYGALGVVEISCARNLSWPLLFESSELPAMSMFGTEVGKLREWTKTHGFKMPKIISSRS